MTTTYTPGPWIRKSGKLWGRDGMTLIGKIEFHTNPIDREYIGNAHLIAAAPDLLEALYAALPLLEDAAEFMKDDFKPGYLGSIVKSTRDAIAKAEGRI